MPFDDERVLFYFRNYARIEEWAALRPEATAAVHAWLAGMKPDVERLASELGPDVNVHACLSDDCDWPSFRLLRSAWPVRDGEPVACVSLEWERKKVVLHGDDSPYAGLRSSKDLPEGAALRRSEQVRAARSSRKDVPSPYWVGYAYVRPNGDFPAVEAGYRVSLLHAFRSAWETYAPFIDEAVREVSAGA